MTIPTFLGGAVMILDLWPLFAGNKSVRQMQRVHRVRVALFTFMVCFGLIPLFHWVYLNGPSSVGSFFQPCVWGGGGGGGVFGRFPALTVRFSLSFTKFLMENIVDLRVFGNRILFLFN